MLKKFGTEVTRYKLDWAALQETNMKLVCSKEISKCDLILFSTKELTFSVNQKSESNIFEQCKVKGRVAILQLDSGTMKNKQNQNWNMNRERL